MNGYLLFNSTNIYITSPFGYRNISGKKEFHNGTDYGTSGKNIETITPFDGKVVKVGKDSYGGKYVYVDFNNGFLGLWYHLDKTYALLGENMKKGDVVGIVGNTGYSTGIHLHFSLIKNNRLSLIYYKADYVDWERFEMPNTFKEKQVMVKYEGNSFAFDGAENKDRYLIYIKDLSFLGFDVTWDKSDLVILEKKVL